MKHGLVLKRVHRVLGFFQKAWMRPYIELNEGKRAAAHNEFEKDFFKLANNAVFGKQMENVRQRFQPLKFVSSPEQYISEVRKNTYVGREVKYSDSMLSLQHKKSHVKLNKPIHIGCAVLDLAKLCMFQFHYEAMLPFYGHQQLRLLMTDTDSLVYSIKTKDVYQDLMQPQLNRHFDFSNYPKAHPLYDVSRKKVAGFFKDEKGGVPIIEFCGLRAKMYAYKVVEGLQKYVGEVTEFTAATLQALEQVCAGNNVQPIEYYDPITGEEKVLNLCSNETKIAKGVKKSVAKTGLTFLHYKECLFLNKAAPKLAVPALASNMHSIYMIDRPKVTLSAYDDKRFVLKNAVQTLAYGHYQIDMQCSHQPKRTRTTH